MTPGLWREGGGVGCGLRRRRGGEALHRVEWVVLWLVRLKTSAPSRATRSTEASSFAVDSWPPYLTKAACTESRHRSRRVRASCRSCSSPEASMTVAAIGHPVGKLLSTSTRRQGAKIASIASAGVAAFRSRDSVSSSTSAPARLRASVMAAYCRPGSSAGGTRGGRRHGRRSGEGRHRERRARL